MNFFSPIYHHSFLMEMLMVTVHSIMDFWVSVDLVRELFNQALIAISAVKKRNEMALIIFVQLWRSWIPISLRRLVMKWLPSANS